jgi:hypothetical protein
MKPKQILYWGAGFFRQKTHLTQTLLDVSPCGGLHVLQAGRLVAELPIPHQAFASFVGRYSMNWQNIYLSITWATHLKL